MYPIVCRKITLITEYFIDLDFLLVRLYYRLVSIPYCYANKKPLPVGCQQGFQKIIEVNNLLFM